MTVFDCCEQNAKPGVEYSFSRAECQACLALDKVAVRVQCPFVLQDNLALLRFQGMMSCSLLRGISLTQLLHPEYPDIGQIRCGRVPLHDKAPYQPVHTDRL